tara:strand:+ start:343 stop:765 length:423 start_codon:yes stop_codon:yes gene_type:complete
MEEAMTEDPRLVHKHGRWLLKTPMIAFGYWDTWQTWKEINDEIKYRGGQTGHDRRDQHLQILHDFIRPCVEVTSLEDLYEMKSWVYWAQPSRGLRNTGEGAMYTKIKVEVNNQIMKLERQKDEIKPGANWIAMKGEDNVD